MFFSTALIIAFFTECPGSAILGYPSHPKRYIPLADTSHSFKERIGTFSLWASGYYHHRALPSFNFRDIGMKPSDIDLEFHIPIPTIPPSVEVMSKEDITNNQALGAAASEARGEVLFLARASQRAYVLIRGCHSASPR